MFKIPTYEPNNKIGYSKFIIDPKTCLLIISTTETSLIKKLLIPLGAINTHVCLDVKSSSQYSSLKNFEAADLRTGYEKISIVAEVELETSSEEESDRDSSDDSDTDDDSDDNDSGKSKKKKGNSKNKPLTKQQEKDAQDKIDLCDSFSNPYKNPGILIDVAPTPAITRFNAFLKAGEFDEFYCKESLMHLFIKNAHNLKHLLSDIDDKQPLIIYIDSETPDILRFVTLFIPPKNEKAGENVAKEEKQESKETDDEASGTEDDDESGSEEDTSDSEEDDSDSDDDDDKNKKAPVRKGKPPAKKAPVKPVKVTKKGADDKTLGTGDRVRSTSQARPDGGKIQEEEIPEMNVVDVPLSDSDHQFVPENTNNYFIFRYSFDKLNSVFSGLITSKVENVTIQIKKSTLTFQSSGPGKKMYTRTLNGEFSDKPISSSYDSKAIHSFLRNCKGIETANMIVGIATDGPIIITFIFTHGRMGMRFNKKDPIAAKTNS